LFCQPFDRFDWPKEPSAELDRACERHLARRWVIYHAAKDERIAVTKDLDAT